MKYKNQVVILFGITIINAALFGAMLCFVNYGYVKQSTVSVDAPGEEDSNLENFPEKFIALTFDDGPHPVYTKRLLEGLKERNVQASFFLLGKNIAGNETLVRQMQSDGHLIGNHSYTHVQLNAGTLKTACEEIEKDNQEIFRVTGRTPIYIRPPFGSWSEELDCLIPMTVVLWDVDPLDWKVKNKNKVVRHVLKHVDENSIILLHDSYETSVDAALELVDTLTRLGYTFVTVDELLID